MNDWKGDWFWWCDKCGAIAPKLELVESEFQLFEDMHARHKDCGGLVGTLNPSIYNSWLSVTEFKNLPEDKRHDEMQLMQKFVYGHCRLRKETEKFRQEYQNRPHCPKCGSFEFAEISTASRVMSVAMWGLASSKIGKQYQCKKCKHKW